MLDCISGTALERIGMNANDLADYLMNFIMLVEDYDESKHEKAAIMLHQQQTRIKQLEETQEYLYKMHDADKAQIEALKRPNNVVGVPADKLAEMQAEIEALNRELAHYKPNGEMGTVFIFEEAQEK